ncbi:excinuclease ABC subunit A [Roseovarius autotrophicus]|uniref:excinuclease ABC subunit A n=1 Tax=Roseovarius autotrophicus TaxID=2824121 RepID=UPI001A05DC61|nr:excinuclease ABC subunit A [Roseovarius autotrophicus]MBE0452499.1 excinuclease ABC subunit A [Roseovarius sp.]
MRQTFLVAAALAALTAAPALADPPGACPPGLAMKGTGCLPPGQAKKIYGIGERIDDGQLIRHPGRHGLDPKHTYYRVGDHVYRVDRETREVLDLIGAVARVLN